MALYYLTVTESKEAYIGTTQAYFLVTNIFTTVIRLTSGILDKELMLTAIPGIAAKHTRLPEPNRGSYKRKCSITTRLAFDFVL